MYSLLLFVAACINRSQDLKNKYTRSDLDNLAEEEKQAWLEVLDEREAEAATAAVTAAETTAVAEAVNNGATGERSVKVEKREADAAACSSNEQNLSVSAPEGISSDTGRVETVGAVFRIGMAVIYGGSGSSTDPETPLVLVTNTRRLTIATHVCLQNPRRQHVFRVYSTYISSFAVDANKPSGNIWSWTANLALVLQRERPCFDIDVSESSSEISWVLR